jgi:opacity protein-like surface antigen
MGRGIRRSIWLLIVWGGIFISTGGYSQNASEGLVRLQEVGLMAGYGKGDYDKGKTLEFIPLGVRFGFDLRPLSKKWGWEPKGLLEFVCEPYTGYSLQPKDAMEFGLAFFIKFGFPLTEKLYPFIEVGTGPYYMTWSSNSQSTQFNFDSQGGLGIFYFFEDHWAVNTGLRFRHVSNADIKKPNGGIQSLVSLIGFSYYY